MSRANTTPLPRWAYVCLGLACIPMGLWASYITLRYFEHGAAALEADPSLRALALSAALMFVASEMAAFGLAALLTERQLWARRWMLTGFAVCVLLLEVCTIVAVQLALTAGADMTQTTTLTQEKDLRARITALEAGAAAKRSDAALQRSAGQISKASRSGELATAEQAQTAALYDQLTQVQSQKRPTLIGLMGREYALAYAVARGILVSLGGLVFFGTAGALLRAARGVSGASAPAGATVTPGAPPKLASYTQPTLVPKGAPTGVSWRNKSVLAAMGLGAGAMAAPMAHAAPAVPTQPAHPAGATEAAATVPTQTHQSGATVPTQAQPAPAGVPTQAQPDMLKSAEKSLKKRAATAVPDGSKIDTGTTGNAAMRYSRVKAAVKAGRLKPSVRAIQASEGGGGLVVRRYLQQLETEGVITRHGRGWALVKGGRA